MRKAPIIVSLLAFVILTGVFLSSTGERMEANSSVEATGQERQWYRIPSADLDGDGNPEQVVILERTSASGLRTYFAALMADDADDAEASIMDEVFIGMEVAMGDAWITRGIVTIGYADRYPWEEVSARPSIAKNKTLHLIDGRLKDTRTDRLDEQIAYALVEDADGQCDATEECHALDATVRDGVDGVWYVESYKDGSSDDAVRAVRMIRRAHHTDEGWVLGETVLEEWQCHEGRGHADLSSEPCL